MIEYIINKLLSNPIYVGILLLLITFIAYSLVKKILKLIFFSIFILIAYIIYMSYSDKNAPEDFKELKESVSDNIEKLKTETTKSINKTKKRC